jgi:peptidoglycan/LPS O-acetylase OafA/YrhL
MSQLEALPEITPHGGQTAIKPENHIAILDALRGIAILLVLGFHFCEGLARLSLPENLFYGIFRTGWIGVDLFFVLSGFLIIGILADTKETPNRMLKFYMRRTLRIFPLYYAVLLLIFFVLPLALPLAARLHLSGHKQTFGGLLDASARQNQVWFWTYSTNILASMDQSRLGGYGHFWSLAVEEQFWSALY